LIDFDRYIPANNELLVPVRRAAVMMWVVGALHILAGICAGSIWLIPVDQLLAQPGVKLPELPPGIAAGEWLHIMATILGIGGFVIGLILVLLAIFVYRGSQIASIISFVLSVLILLYFGINGITSLIIGNPAFILVIVLMAIMGTQCRWLFRAIRAGGQIQKLRQQHQMQYWYAQQQQPPQAQGSYGYGTPPTRQTPPQ
jgi:hypothetical protein